MANIKNSIVELIGNTPMVEFHRLEKELGLKARIVGKLEYFNPGGSSKDRIALAMIEEAERTGKLKEGSTIVELTSGNTGIGLAEVAAAKGYGIKLAVQPTASKERIQIVEAYGAKTFPMFMGEDILDSLDDVQREADETPNSYVPNQFSNERNAGIHRETTGPEIYRDTDGEIDILIAGVGTGGTLSGSAEYLKSKKPGVQVVAVQPHIDSVAKPGYEVEEITGVHKFTEIEERLVPDNVHAEFFDEIADVKTEEALTALQKLAVTEGILVGYSGGAALYEAIRQARKPENEGKLIVVILADNGERYLSQDIFVPRESQKEVTL